MRTVNSKSVGLLVFVALGSLSLVNVTKSEVFVEPASAKSTRFHASQNRLITNTSIGSAHLGMTVAAARKALRGLTLTRTSDAEGIALISVNSNGKRLMTLYAGESDPNAVINERAVIELIEAWDESYHTAVGVHPRMPLLEVEHKYGKLREITQSEIESREFATFAGQPAQITLRVGNENGTAGLYSAGQRSATGYTPGAYVLTISVRQSVKLPSSPNPRFEDYPAAQEFSGKPAAPIIVNKRAKQYRTMIREDAQAGPNFADHYTVAAWGCASTCVGFAIVDARTGRIYFHPVVFEIRQVPYQVEDVLQFRRDSKLLIVSGEVVRGSQPGPQNPAKLYYQWKNNRFYLLKTAEIRRETGAPPQRLGSTTTPSI